jgi:hypothetical protein
MDCDGDIERRERVIDLENGPVLEKPSRATVSRAVLVHEKGPSKIIITPDVTCKAAYSD